MNMKNLYMSLGQKIGASIHAPSSKQAQLGLFAIGVGLLAAGLCSSSMAQDYPDARIDFNDERIGNAVQAIFGYIEGKFGALVMVISGLGAILSSAFGQYKAALGCLVVAVGAFILRSVVSTFFDINDLDV